MEELPGRWARTLTFKDFTIAAYACTCMEGDFEDPDQWRLWLMLSCSLSLHNVQYLIGGISRNSGGLRTLTSEALI